VAGDNNGLAALSDPTRREIFERLAAAPLAVGELAAGLPVSRPAVSQHLRVLSEAGLVVGERARTRRLYSVDREAVAALRDYFDGFLAADAESLESVHATIVVSARRERAFSTFTEDIGGWWPSDRHFLADEVAEMVVEPHVGGHVYERGVDGSVCRWARVLALDPPARVVFSWDIDPCWQVERDPARTSEVELRFVEETPERTRVELEHRRLDRHGKGWEQMRDALASPGGWRYGLGAFERRCR
jgi:DNA-binding transcriptional ArsR family regulator